jgi:hypothetical protein
MKMRTMEIHRYLPLCPLIYAQVPLPFHWTQSVAPELTSSCTGVQAISCQPILAAAICTCPLFVVSKYMCLTDTWIHCVHVSRYGERG